MLRKALSNVEAVLAGICFILLTLIINIEVVRRYCFLSPGAYSEEVARYLFIYSILFSMAYAVKENAHIVTDIIPERLPVRLRTGIDLFATAVFFLFSLFMVKLSMQYMTKMILFERLTEAMAVPLYYFCAALPLGFIATAMRCAERFLRLSKALRANEKQ